MLKKAIIIISLLVLILSLAACNKGGNIFQTNKNIEDKLPAMASSAEIIKNENNHNNQQELPIEYSYEVIGSNYSKSDDKLKYNIKYPKISGLSENDNQKKINSTLKDEALKVLKYYEESYGSVEVNIDYKIVLKNSNILSIQYAGVGYVSNAAHPNSLFYTTNINMKTGYRLRLKDIVNIDKDFAYKFLNGDFKALLPEHSEVLKNLANEKIQKGFIEADSLDNIGTEEQSDVFSYFTNDSLGISISVGHAMGDHAEFEIKYQDIKDNIITQSEIWKE